MKGILLAGISFIFFLGLSVLILRFYKGNKEFKVFFANFLLSSILYSTLSFSFSPDLGFLSLEWIEKASKVDFLYGLAILAMVFHGFWTFAYASNLGPSGDLMTELYERGEEGASETELLAIFLQEENDLDIILARRIPKLLKEGYIKEEGNGYRVLPRGLFYGRITHVLKRALNSEGG